MPEEKEKTEEDLHLCEKCGSIMVKEDEEWFCPNCDGKIDFFGDEDVREI